MYSTDFLNEKTVLLVQMCGYRKYDPAMAFDLVENLTAVFILKVCIFLEAVW